MTPVYLGDTFFKFACVGRLFFARHYLHCISLQIRQRRTEEHFTAALKDQGTHQHIRTRLESFTLEESAENGYPVTVQARNLDNNELFEIKT
jgi:hypothetical protein